MWWCASSTSSPSRNPCSHAVARLAYAFNFLTAAPCKQARNIILSAWRADVDRHIDESAARALLPAALTPYGSVAWKFLDTYGFINFGLAPEILAYRSQLSTPPGTVVVLGAGLAGLAAARQLVKFGHTVLICEAKARAGGRVQTVRLEVRCWVQPRPTLVDWHHSRG